MKQKYINIAGVSEADPKIRPGIAHLYIQGSKIMSTDSYRATILTRKVAYPNFPDVAEFMPKPSDEDLTHGFTFLLLGILKVAKQYHKEWFIDFGEKIMVDDTLDLGENEFGIDGRYPIVYFLEIINMLNKAEFSELQFYNKNPESPLLIVAENEEVKVEHLIMPLKRTNGTGV